jgi:hypothetical protein
MLLWQDFIFTEICGGYARKSSKLFYNSAPKVEQYYLQSTTCLARVNIRYNSSHGFAVFIHLATVSYFMSISHEAHTSPEINTYMRRQAPSIRPKIAMSLTTPMRPRPSMRPIELIVGRTHH